MPEPFSQLVDIRAIPKTLGPRLDGLTKAAVEARLLPREDADALLKEWRDLEASLLVLGSHLHQWQKTSGIRQELAFFAVDMEEKLRKYDHRGDQWRRMSSEWLLSRLRDEVVELEGALAQNDKKEIRREAADVANFACFIAEAHGKEST